MCVFVCVFICFHFIYYIVYDYVYVLGALGVLLIIRHQASHINRTSQAPDCKYNPHTMYV